MTWGRHLPIPSETIINSFFLQWNSQRLMKWERKKIGYDESLMIFRRLMWTSCGRGLRRNINCLLHWKFNSLELFEEWANFYRFKRSWHCFLIYVGMIVSYVKLLQEMLQHFNFLLHWNKLFNSPSNLSFLSFNTTRRDSRSTLRQIPRDINVAFSQLFHFFELLQPGLQLFNRSVYTSRFLSPNENISL